MDDVVAAAVTQQVPQNAYAKDQRLDDSAPSAVRVQRHPRPDGQHAYLREVGLLAAVPLAHRRVGQLVPLRGETLGEVAVPALGAADGVREQAVIDHADPHVRASIPDLIGCAPDDEPCAPSVTTHK